MTENARARLADIAEAAGVSEATVSRVLNDRPGASAATRQAVLTALDVLRASFPAGTLTGAPKIRAMEIIDELEPTKRGLYGGACGYLSFAGDMDLAITIRTGVLKDGLLHVQAAAGIVADSILENEWQETENKARAVIRAAELAENGLDPTTAPQRPSVNAKP